MRKMASISLFILFFFGAILTDFTTPAWGFDYSAYKPSSLKEIGDRTKEAAAKHQHEGGWDFYRERLKVKGRLYEYPLEISEGAQRVLEYYFKSFGLNLEHLKLFTYQLNLEDSGYSFILVFQRQLIPFLQKELKLGDFVNLYVLFGIHDVKNKKTILLVNEFHTDTGGIKEGHLPYFRKEG